MMNRIAFMVSFLRIKNPADDGSGGGLSRNEAAPNHGRNVHRGAGIESFH
jgi:hypothetical protein